ncbi:carboxylesterase family protein [Luteolibacter flavescens]|uniref:Carboxylic ester hydrolase n=1 Tax=Luteolibacter flavescens TaxID=1859460 RepID=A0ABT3FIY8_9BACT|nr:carboxylesterase/lipase family protein [Luteolibacter flavescens]MCW1883526.1 carboxylesterase family protein [Luteolibacter flavescens]
MKSLVMPFSGKAALLALLIAPLSSLADEGKDVPALQVRVTGGTIEGSTGTDASVRAFKGIPFAKPPVGELRWKAPQPAEAWDGVKKATTYAPGPIQESVLNLMLGAPTDFSEDCLYLNVWTPAKSAGERLPVMYWIHGGAFAMGSTSTPIYDGSQLTKRGVVVVSVGYRLGAFGFLAHPELTKEGGKGNFGLLDQIAGLKWVRENIAAFGGDPGCVTIFGESAGSVSVGLLATSPKAKDLFHRVIAQSGSSFSPPKTANEAGHFVPTLQLAEVEGVKFLEKLGAKDIAAARALPAKKVLKGGFAPMPCIDADVVPMDSHTAFLRGEFNDTPVMTGSNSDDGGMFALATTPGRFRETAATFGEHADKILAAYPHAKWSESSRAGKDAIRDICFAWPAWTWARLQSAHGKNKAFLYYYDHRNSPDKGADHGAEIAYIFGNVARSKPADRAMSDLVSSYWVNFAKTGDPNGPGLPEWTAFTGKSGKAMDLDAQPGMHPVPNLEQLKVWDAYYESCREKAQAP